MSFPKAKLIRFNDISTCTPSPAEYYVNIKEKAKSVAIPQSERFPRDHSPPPPSEIGSTQSTPCFRTPVALKKKNIGGSSSKALLKQLSEVEILNDKIIECNNKDAFIKELTEQLDELKDKINDLEQDKCQLEVTNAQFLEKIENFSKHNEKELKYAEQIKQFEEKWVNETRNFEIKIEHILEDHTKELLTKSNEILELKHYYEDLLKDLKETSKKEKELFIMLQDENVKNLIDGHEITLNKLKNYIEAIKEECQNEIKQLQKVHQEENQSVITSYEEKIAKMKVKQAVISTGYIDDVFQLKKQFEKEIRTVKDKFNEEKSNLMILHDKNLKKITDEYDQKLMASNDKISALTKDFDEKILKLKQFSEFEKQKILESTDFEIAQLKEKFTESQILFEMQMKEKCCDIEETWKIKLQEKEKEANAILKECQAISEYNIIQCELEKGQIKRLVNDKVNEYNQLQNKYDDVYINYKQLQDKYTKLQTKLYKLIKEVNEKDRTKQQLEQLISEKHAFEITIGKCQETIEVLKNRLTDSDKDVEQLKNELHISEENILKLEEQLNSTILELEQVKEANEMIELQCESAVKLIETKVKTDLIEKVDGFKMILEKKLCEEYKKLQNVQKDLSETMNLLREQQEFNERANVLISFSKEELDALECENKDLLKKNERLEIEKIEWQECRNNLEKEILDMSIRVECLRVYENEIEELKGCIENLREKSNSYRSDCEKYKRKMEEYQDKMEKKNEKLVEENLKQRKMIKDHQDLIEPFKDQLEDYELEKNSLVSEKSCIEKEAKELGLKYATILGHQNQKQKIKYVVNLQTRYEEVLKGKLEVESKLRSQNKTIEKLKTEMSEMKKKLKKGKPVCQDKENLNSPNRSLNTSKIESPGPLRERN